MFSEMLTRGTVSAEQVKRSFIENDPAFEPALRSSTAGCVEFSQALLLHNIRRRALRDGRLTEPGKALRLAVVGGCTLSPLADLIEHFASVLADVRIELWKGEFDNYVSEILDEGSELFEFKPDLVLLLPSVHRCRYSGPASAAREEQLGVADGVASEILGLCDRINRTSKAQVVLANFPLPSHHDPGPLRNTSLTSDYAFRRYVNTQLGFRAPEYVHLCDVEFLANRLGTIAAEDPKAWFEGKQPYSAALMVQVAKEVGHALARLTRPTKKVIVLDLDNTLWGGVIGDDGLEGIEIGTTSPRGEAFRAFQQYLLELAGRGILLGVCSKNDHANAVEPFLKHPEMVLKLSDIVNFKANWDPKADNIREMATELNLGLDSFVFVDDNPAEIEIVRQFVPEVTGICLGDDPSTFVRALADSRFFEVRNVTAEDFERAELYSKEAKRQELKSTATDMDSYLSSLEMVAEVSPFSKLDVPRIAQLINKSNQFNLTTRRRTEAEVLAMIEDPEVDGFTIRLADRFGNHGLIAVVIGQFAENDYVVDTWLMSCRVLKRQVEQVTLNQIVESARRLGSERVIGVYKPTVKNAMVAGLYEKLGFSRLLESAEETTYELRVDTYQPSETRIRVELVSNG
jgi:FkbH-like protein